jgi:hypothetical protein
MSREEKLAKVPVEARLEIATTALTGMVNAYGVMLKSAVGEEKFNEFEQSLFNQGGMGAKQIVDSFGLPAQTVKDFAETISCIGTICFGPGYQSRVVESSEDHCVGQTKMCPIHDRKTEAGIPDDGSCAGKHKKYVEGLLEALNLDYAFTVENHMADGGNHCQWSISK